MKYVQATALSLFILCSCSRTIDCEDLPILPVFVGYSHSDVDTLVLRKYRAGSGFSSLIDTFLITKTNASYEGLDSIQIVVYTFTGTYGGVKTDAVHGG